MRQWWHLNIDNIAESLNTDLSSGLSSEEAKSKLAKYGHNQLKEARKQPPIFIFFTQFNDFIIWVLIGAAIVSGFLKEWVDAAAIMAIVVLNAILGFIQEYRAEKALAALKKLSSPTSKVIRNGQRDVIPSDVLVQGDLIELEAGDNIPADSRLVWITSNFAVQEASLTGESNPVSKTIFILEEEDVPLADRANMVYMGTSVSSGKAKAIVVETGMNTELGKIAGMVQEIKQETTPLQKKLEDFGKWIVYICFFLVAGVFLLELLRGGQIIDVFLTAVSLAVAAIPEGLPAVVTIALALGVKRMVKRNALIRKLPSVETLGCATVICSDKTGTLTKNEMTVQAIFSDGNLFKVTGTGFEPNGKILFNDKPVNLSIYPGLEKSLSCGVLCNAADLIYSDTGYKIFGDPTEAALLTVAAKAGLWKNKLEEDLPFVNEIPFDSERKKMTVVRKYKSKLVAFVKGAPDVFLRDCTKIEENASIRDLTDRDREKILAVNDELAFSAMRVLAVGYRIFDEIPQGYEASLVEKEIIFSGLFAMIDPPREEVKEAIRKCNSAGIRTVMITGDHKNTAIAIAKQLGFFKEDSVALSGEELDRMNNEELERDIQHIPVYARVSPEHKLRIVSILRKRKEIVAMTGDGVNDAPAVKEADIGVAMGITGTDVTKEVSDMVITDDNFASIVSAVEEGRGIYDNIKKFIHYLLSCNTGEVLVMFVSSLIGLPVPLLPINILWVNLVTDGFPALALGVDPVGPDVMARPPRPVKEPIITRQMAVLIVAQGAFIALCTLVAFSFVLFIEKAGIVRARTAAFIVLTCTQLFHSFNCRSQTESIFKLGFFTNKKLILATLISFFLQIAVIYIPFLQGIFKTTTLGVFDWLLVIIISSFPLWAMEIIKMFKKGKRA